MTNITRGAKLKCGQAGRGNDALKKSCGIIKIRLYGELPTTRGGERITGQAPGALNPFVRWTRETIRTTHVTG